MSTAAPTARTDGSPAPKSALDAVGAALENVKRVLFSPFSLRKWLLLALVAFVAGVVGGGGGGHGGGGRSGGGPGGTAESAWSSVVAWYEANAELVLVGVVVGGVVLLGLGLAVLYARSVFRFIFLESVITAETRIGESWHKNKREGLAYMWWRIGFGLVTSIVLAVVVGLPGLLVYSLVTGQAGDAAKVATIVLTVLVGVFLLLVCGVVIGLVDALTRDFVVPLMYVRRINVLEGWGALWPILRENKLSFVVYFLIKFVSAAVAGMARFLGVIVGLAAAAIVLGILGVGGWGLVAVLGITWEWWYLWVLVPLGIGVMLLLGYWITCVLLPIPVYFQSYALKYLGFVEPEAETI